MEQRICQSCAMPLTKEDELGTNADGSKNGEYCRYCFDNGHYAKEETMEEMIEFCVPFALEAGVYKDANAARADMLRFFPTLKRWRKA